MKTMNKKTIKSVKKMNTGGSSGPCSAKGLCPEYSGSTKTGKCIPCSAGVYGGLVGSAAAAIGTGIKMIGDKIKSNNQKQKAAKLLKSAKEAVQNTPTAKFKKDLDDKLKTQKRGGVVKSKKK